MRKYLVFIVSFGLLYIVFEIVSGMILTSMFTPDFSSIQGGINQTVSFGTQSFIPMLIALLAGSIAFMVSQKREKLNYS